MFDLFRQDAKRWVTPGSIADDSEVTLWRVVKLLYRHMPLRAMLWFRFGSWCKHRGIPGLPGIVQRHIYSAHGLEIWIGADIGGGLYIAHPIGTVVAVERMGVNCSIIASVTLGLREDGTFPDIGDNVFIGAGARVIGGVRVGDNSVIGANAVVVHDVPAGATVVGIPARVVGSEGAVGGDT